MMKATIARRNLLLSAILHTKISKTKLLSLKFSRSVAEFSTLEAHLMVRRDRFIAKWFILLVQIFSVHFKLKQSSLHFSH